MRRKSQQQQIILQIKTVRKMQIWSKGQREKNVFNEVLKERSFIVWWTVPSRDSSLCFEELRNLKLPSIWLLSSVSMDFIGFLQTALVWDSDGWKYRGKKGPVQHENTLFLFQSVKSSYYCCNSCFIILTKYFKIKILYITNFSFLKHFGLFLEGGRFSN